MAVFHNLVPGSKNDLIAKDEYLKRLEKMYDESSWEEILFMINEILDLEPKDEVVLNIIQYVHHNNKISFKQWKVLRLFLKENNPDKKFKYGK